MKALISQHPATGHPNTNGIPRYCQPSSRQYPLQTQSTSSQVWNRYCVRPNAPIIPRSEKRTSAWHQTNQYPPYTVNGMATDYRNNMVPSQPLREPEVNAQNQYYHASGSKPSTGWPPYKIHPEPHANSRRRIPEIQADSNIEIWTILALSSAFPRQSTPSLPGKTAISWVK